MRVSQFALPTEVTVSEFGSVPCPYPAWAEFGAFRQDRAVFDDVKPKSSDGICSDGFADQKSKRISVFSPSNVVHVAQPFGVVWFIAAFNGTDAANRIDFSHVSLQTGWDG